jgi:phosphotriesterase-related protein
MTRSLGVRSQKPAGKADEVGVVHTYRGPIQPEDVGSTLIHEHIFVRNPELETSLPDAEWNPHQAVGHAVQGLTDLRALGIQTVVDLTVPGLGRDVRLVADVAARVSINLIASTGWYTPNVLPTFFQFNGPGRLIDRVDPLIELFVGDLTAGIAGTRVRAGMLKVMTDADGITPDVARVMTAAAVAHRETGATVTTHSNPASRNGLLQQAFLGERGVAPDRIIIGHSGDSEDLDYLRELMNNGSTIGLDRFGMEQVVPDERRVDTLLALLEQGYADRIVISHDAAFYSHVTPPSWRARAAPRWRMDTISRSILPALRDAGVPDETLEQILVENPRRLLAVAA